MRARHLFLLIVVFAAGIFTGKALGAFGGTEPGSVDASVPIQAQPVASSGQPVSGQPSARPAVDLAPGQRRSAMDGLTAMVPRLKSMKPFEQMFRALNVWA